MATANPPAPRQRRRRLWPLLALLGVAALLAGFWKPLTGYAAIGSAYGAHVACSCRYAGGRSLEDCRKDFEPGMELIALSEDRAAKRVTATFALVKSTSATYREGWGCVVERWQR